MTKRILRRLNDKLSKFRKFLKSKRSRLKNLSKNFFYNLKTINFQLVRKKVFKRIVHIGRKTKFVLVKIVPVMSTILIVIVLVERITNPKGFLALAIENKNDKNDKNYKINSLKYLIKYNSRSLQELYYLIQTNSLTVKNVITYSKRNPKTVTLIMVGSLGVATYLTYKIIKTVNTPDEIPEYARALSPHWQNLTLEFVSNMTELAIRGNQGAKIMSSTKRIVMNTLGNKEQFENAVSTLVENGSGLSAAKGLLNKSNDSIWKRMQHLLMIDGSKYVPINSVPSKLQDFIRAQPPSIVPVPGHIQNVLGKTVDVPLSVAELREMVKAVDKFTEHIPTSIPKPAKLNQVLQITKLADNLVRNVETKKMVDIAEMMFVYSVNETDLGNLTNLKK